MNSNPTKLMKQFVTIVFIIVTLFAPKSISFKSDYTLIIYQDTKTEFDLLFEKNDSIKHSYLLVEDLRPID